MSVFVTGATGFIGRRLVPLLSPAGLGPVRCLVRDPAAATWSREGEAIPVTGTLHEPETYRPALRESDAVVHLAGLTGKGSLAEHRRTNTEGTRRLLEAGLAEGVERFVHVSTIAVEYEDRRHYPYARSKEEAEAIVRASSSDWMILRPTIVLGPGSPLADRFRSLTGAPVMPVFGRGDVRINPVHVDDVCAVIVAALAQHPLGRRTASVGGADVLRLEEFLRRVRRARLGRDGPVVHVPVRAIIAVLGLLERFLMPVLPVSAGQFYSFVNDGVAATGEAPGPPPEARHGVDEMIREMLQDV